MAIRGVEMAGKWDCQKSRRAEGISDVRRKKGGGRRDKRSGSTVLVVLERGGQGGEDAVEEEEGIGVRGVEALEYIDGGVDDVAGVAGDDGLEGVEEGVQEGVPGCLSEDLALLLLLVARR